MNNLKLMYLAYGLIKNEDNYTINLASDFEDNPVSILSHKAVRFNSQGAILKSKIHYYGLDSYLFKSNVQSDYILKLLNTENRLVRPYALNMPAEYFLTHAEIKQSWINIIDNEEYKNNLLINSTYL